MAINNDDKILQLRKVVAEKRADLEGKNSRFSPVTTCVIPLYNTTYNINTLNKEALTILAAQIRSLQIAAEDLGFDVDSQIINGFTYDQWLTDLKAKLAAIEYREKSAELKILEGKLEAMLSDKKKTELELETISGLLDNLK